MKRILCWLGVHEWDTWQLTRYCVRCNKNQRLSFFSNRTHEWVDQ